MPTKVEIAEETGHAILVCACGSRTDKGCPPIEGQDDSGFVCETCQAKKNREGILAKTPTTEISGGESMTISAADVGSVPAELLAGAKGKATKAK